MSEDFCDDCGHFHDLDFDCPTDEDLDEFGGCGDYRCCQP